MSKLTQLDLPLGIPPALRRDTDNRAEFMMSDSNVETIEAPATKRGKRVGKANGHAKPPVKAAGKPKAKAAAKPAAKAKTAPKAAAKATKAKSTAKESKSKIETDAYGFRKGSSKSKAVAMYARKGGATLAEVKAAVGSVQLNVLVALEAEGRKVDKVKETREGKRAVTRYFLKS